MQDSTLDLQYKYMILFTRNQVVWHQPGATTAPPPGVSPQPAGASARQRTPKLVADDNESRPAATIIKRSTPSATPAQSGNP